MGDTRRQSRKGVNSVASLVEGAWCCGWEEFSAHNDDAVDGIVIMRRGTQPARDTGGIVFAQIKCGTSYLREIGSYPNHICVDLGADYVHRHMNRWRRLPGPVVLIYVSDTIPGKAWWVDLRGDCISPTNKGVVLVPRLQRFAAHSKGEFHKLCGGNTADRELPRLVLENDELVPFKLSANESLKKVAWTFYKTWRQESTSHVHPQIGRVIVNRVGWKHITHLKRNQHSVIYSWLLLCAAKKMIFSNFPVAYLGNAMITRSEEVTSVFDYFGIKPGLGPIFCEERLRHNPRHLKVLTWLGSCRLQVTMIRSSRKVF